MYMSSGPFYEFNVKVDFEITFSSLLFREGRIYTISVLLIRVFLDVSEFHHMRYGSYDIVIRLFRLTLLNCIDVFEVMNINVHYQRLLMQESTYISSLILFYVTKCDLASFFPSSLLSPDSSRKLPTMWHYHLNI